MSIKTFLNFSLNGEKYAIDASCVQEIKAINEIEINPIQAPDFIKGCTNFRQRITPIIDLEELYHKKGKSFLSQDSIVFIQIDQEYTGLIIKGLPNVIEFSENNISFEVNESLQKKCIQAIGTYYNVSYFILNLHQLLLENSLKYYRGENDSGTQQPSQHEQSK